MDRTFKGDGQNIQSLIVNTVRRSLRNFYVG